MSGCDAMRSVALIWVGGVVTLAVSCSSSDRNFGGGSDQIGGAGAAQLGSGGAADPVPTGGIGPADGGAISSDSNGGQPAGEAGGAGKSALSGAGAGGAGGLAPPDGAFAWYKATKDDVATLSATIADGNEFIKTFWVKTNLTATALQPDVDGKNTATALYDGLMNSTAEHSMKHALASSSQFAPKTLRIRARMGQRRYLWIGAPASDALAPLASFDLLNGVVSANYAVISAKIELIKDLWYTCEVTFIGGPEYWLGVSSDPAAKAYIAPNTNEPAVWIQQAEVEQTHVSAWHDRIGQRDLSGAKGDPTGVTDSWAWQPSSVELNGLPALVAYYRGAHLAAGDPADWTFLHDGSGGSLVILHQQSVPSKAYANSLGTEYLNQSAGAHLGVSASDSKLWGFGSTNANGQSLFSISGGSTKGPKWLAGVYGSAQTPDAQLFEDGVMVASANAAAKPSVEASSSPLMLGNASGGAPIAQQVHEVIVYNRTLDSADIARLTDYFAVELRQ
jgi:Concanavalin A-like lectin/glucanases superfamily